MPDIPNIGSLPSLEGINRAANADEYILSRSEYDSERLPRGRDIRKEIYYTLTQARDL